MAMATRFSGAGSPTMRDCSSWDSPGSTTQSRAFSTGSAMTRLTSPNGLQMKKHRAPPRRQSMRPDATSAIGVADFEAFHDRSAGRTMALRERSASRTDLPPHHELHVGLAGDGEAEPLV